MVGRTRRKPLKIGMYNYKRNGRTSRVWLWKAYIRELVIVMGKDNLRV